MRNPTSPANPADRARAPGPLTPPADRPLFQTWQAEVVRLRETQWGPLEDRLACQKALREPPALVPRILARAAWLANQGSLHARLAQWALSARWSLIALWVLAGLAGTGAAATALGRGDVNLSRALLGLLGLNTLTFLLWLASHLPGLPASTMLSRAWLWLTQRLVHGPDSALAAQAFVSLLARTRAWRSLLGLVSHGAWTAAFLGIIPTLTLLLSTKRYTFHWETTLLSPEAFVTLTRALSAWPQSLGFPPPGSPDIAASVGLQTLPASVQADWSWWLIGCIMAWGLIPRLVALILCIAHLRHSLRQPLIDTNLPGWIELRERLLPTHQNLGVDRPAPGTQAPPTRPPRPGPAQAPAALLRYELGDDLDALLADRPDQVQDWGRCDSREDRERIRTWLVTPPAHLLVVCDARLTPDRGTQAWLNELRHSGTDLAVLCLAPPPRATGDAPASPDRHPAWSRMLGLLDIPQETRFSGWIERVKDSRHD